MSCWRGPGCELRAAKASFLFSGGRYIRRLRAEAVGTCFLDNFGSRTNPIQPLTDDTGGSIGVVAAERAVVKDAADAAGLPTAGKPITPFTATRSAAVLYEDSKVHCG